MEDVVLGSSDSPTDSAEESRVLVGEKEYFPPHEDLPWFKKAKVEDILNLELHHSAHLYSPAFDTDLNIDSLEHPERHLLVAEA